MKNKYDNTKKLLLLLICLSTSYLFSTCTKQIKIDQKVKYYIYGYYENNWLLVRNAVIIKEEVLNDSISRLQITNHNRTVKNELGISVFFDRKLFQKKTPKGIYFSKDSINYELFFDYMNGDEICQTFPIYYFFGIGENTIRLDTEKNYLKERKEFYLKEKEENSDEKLVKSIIEPKIIYKPQEVYYDFRSYIVIGKGQIRSGYYQILFNKELPFPLFCSDIIMQDYYLLSDAIGFDEADIYIDQAYDAVWNDYLRESDEPLMKNVTLPSSWLQKLIEENLNE